MDERMGDDPMTIHPVYDGLIFRATGNFGSTIFDPLPTQLNRRGEVLQIIVCDDCIKAKAKLVTRIYNVRRTVAADAEPFNPRGWSYD